MNHILRVNDDALKVFLEDSKYKVEFLSKAKPLRPQVKREEFRDRAFQLTGHSLIEANLRVKQDILDKPNGGAEGGAVGGNIG